VHLLARVARVDAHPGRAGGSRELAEAGEGDRVTAPERLGDGVEKCIDSLARIALAQIRLRRDAVDEVLLCHICHGTLLLEKYRGRM
jgi:hypothetical protein